MLVNLVVLIVFYLAFNLLNRILKKNSWISYLFLVFFLFLIMVNSLIENDYNLVKVFDQVTIDLKSENESSYEDFCQVHFLDVGQADSELIICNDEAALIDGGNVADSSFIYSYLEKIGISELKYIIASHPHEDHIGGLAGALNYAKVTDLVLSPTREYESKAFFNFKKYVEEQNMIITIPEEGNSYDLGKAKITILSVLKNTSTNNSSIVCRLDFENTSFLFTGDAEYEAEKHLLDIKANLKADVLKVGHHGSDTSTMYSFLREIMPKIAVIEVGANNSYGHPSSETIDKLQQADSQIYRTDINGNIIITSDGDKLKIESEK